MERAHRRLTLNDENEEAIRQLCTQADAACYALRHGDTVERIKSAAALDIAWKKVNYEVMT